MRSLEIELRSYIAGQRENRSEPKLETQPDDRALLQAALADRREFAALYRRYVERIFRYCTLRLDSTEAAEDITSEVFVRALANLDTCRGDFSPWLFQITRNAIIDRYRKQRQVESLDGDAFQVADCAPGPDALAERQMQVRAVRQALVSLPEGQRTVLEMQLAGWQGEAIAKALGRSEAAVKMLRYRAVSRLRELLEDEFTPGD